MTIHEYGKSNAKTVVLVHPSVVMWDFFEYLIPLLEKDCHVIIPALPGYDENDSQQNFTSVENIAGELAAIASIATRRNGILSADNYDLLSQSYTEGTQSAFLVGILAVFGVLLGCALLVVLNLSAYEVQQQRLSLLLTLGVSPKKLVLSYAKLLLPVIVGTTLLVNIVVYAAVSRIVPIQSILDLIRIHISGRVFEFHKPVGSQIMVSILLMVFWLSAALLPIFSFIRKKASKGDIL